MASIERTAYPRFKRIPNSKQLNEIYSPSSQEIMVAHNVARGDASILCFLTLMKCFQRLGYFPPMSSVPKVIVTHIRDCLYLAPNTHPTDSLATLYRHQKTIREFLHVIPYGAHARHLAIESVYKAAQVMDNPADLINVSIAELIKESCELPAFSTLDRLVRRVRTLVNTHFFQSVWNHLRPEEKQKLDQLLEPSRFRSRSDFNYIKELPKSPKFSHFKELQAKYAWLQSLGGVERLLEGVPNAKIKHFAAEARALDRSEIGKFLPPKRYMLLLSMIQRASVHTRDHLVEMFIKRVGFIHKKGREELELLREQHRSKMEMLISVLTDVLQKTNEHLDDAVLGKQVREVLATRGGTEFLLNDCEAISSHNGNNYLPLLWKHYKKNKSALFRLIRSLNIDTTTQNQSLMDALSFLLTNETKRVDLLPASISLSFASTQWRRTVTVKTEEGLFLSRRHFEVCVFSQLASELKTGDLFVTGSENYADYREQLLSWEECKPMVADFCAEMKFTPTSEGFVQQLKDLLTQTAEEVDKNYPNNGQVVINEDGEPTLKRSVRKDSIPNVTDLETTIYQHLPDRNIIEILCNVEHWLQWTRYFGPLSGSDPKLENPVERYIILSFGYGCNLGPAQTSKHMRGLVTQHMLSFVNRRHVTANKLDEAIREMVNCYNLCDLPKVWGDGTTAAADGTKFDLYEENLVSEYHIRYGGYGGIAYHHVSDTYIALFSHFIPCGVWEAVYIIDALMKNKSDIQPDTLHADTQGQSTPVFALAYLLGIKLMPRIRNWKNLTFFRPDKNTVYKYIDSLFSDTIDWELLETHWKDLFQVVLSIKAGKVLPSTLLLKLSNYSQKNRLYQAFQELGRVIRTIFLLQYISDIQLREQITASTNKVEAYNGFSKWFFFGGEGIIAENDPEEQEKRIKYLDLVSNAVILQNVVDMTGILKKLASEGTEFTRSDVAALSPYMTRHIKRFGDYVIDLKNAPDPIDRNMLIAVKEENSS
ncbi:Tn3 family transposase [Paenibacillus agricola]|uniref:Tn3 family transposase n=1 Tax=Paenibacillus agricola TaxID=2716264 RepID=A0ABX0JH97_9BACL|nr:Tn3 family transposase [Paenibacillus agricola]NHN33221.1 Tn3 family transposase [Paenibacillus agricola]